MKRIIVLFSILLLLVPFTAVAQINWCEGNFDCDDNVDGSDASKFKSDFGRNSGNRPCPTLDDCPNPWSPCPEGMLICNNACVDPMTDESYCGSCSNSCASGEVCFAGTCYTGGVVFPAPVPKTGQTICYDSSGDIISCDGIGQDGDLQKGVAWPNPRFTDNGNGTVTDNLTGLIWLKNANCYGTRSWAQAPADCNGLNSGECGLSDGSVEGNWRLPSLFELESLRDMAYYNLALSNTAGTGQWTEGDPFNIVQSSYYWSSTTYAPYPSAAWIVSFGDGPVGGGGKLSGGPFCVWPVRGGQ